MSDRHAEHEWQLQALQGRPRPIAPAPVRPTGKRRAQGLTRFLAVLAVALVAAGVALMLHAGPINYLECFK